MKIFAPTIVISFFLISELMAMNLLCSNQDYAKFNEGFGSLEETEKLFPKFVYLNNNFVQWGSTEKDWSEGIKSLSNGQNSWEIIENGMRYILTYDPRSRILTVKLYRGKFNEILPPVYYKSCEIDQEKDPMGGLLD